MKYTVAKSVIDVLGTMWMPAVPGGTQYKPWGSDIDNMRDDNGKITRESVSLWLDSHAGDFSGIIDFFASIEDGPNTVEIPWTDEENEMTYNSCMFGDENQEDEDEKYDHSRAKEDARNAWQHNA